MGSIVFAVMFLIRALMWFLNVKWYRALYPIPYYIPKEKHKLYRRLVGLMWLVAAAAMFYIFFITLHWKQQFGRQFEPSWGQALKYYVPVACIPIIAAFVIRVTFAVKYRKKYEHPET